jgi:hypothetical protein
MAIPRNLANFAAFANAGSAGPTIQGLTAGRGAGAIDSNVAFGNKALISNTTGIRNVAIGGGNAQGNGPLQVNTTGFNCIAIGSYALGQSTNESNTGIGTTAGFSITTGLKNLIVYAGEGAGQADRLTAGSTNVVTIGTPDQEVFRFTSTTSTQLDGINVGRGAGRVNSNVAVGGRALLNNTTGGDNVAVGGGPNNAQGALEVNTTGFANIAIGGYSLNNNTAGSFNVGIGISAGGLVTTGQKNISFYAGDPQNVNYLSAGSVGLISIGTGDGERLRIQTDAFRAQLVYDQTTGSAANVFVASDGKMSRSTSSQRYKKNIQDAVHGLEKVLQLRPVTFNHINPDEDGIVYGGLIAEEVHDLGLTEFVEYTWDGRPDSLRYGHMVSLLVKAVQELNARVAALETQGG